VASFLRSAGLLTLVYVAVFILERVPRFRFRELPFRRRFFATDVTWYLILVCLSAIAVFVVRPLLEPLTIEPLARLIRELPAAARFLIALLVFDLVSYNVHRGFHRSDLLWNVHKVHHSSLELDGLATTRQHMFENLLRFVPGQVAMFLIGIPVAQVAPAVAFAAAYGVLDHSNLNFDLRWMERVMVTPRLHRRHHVPSTTMNNYGALFTVWDKMFGTFVAMNTDAEERFGCPGEVDTYPQYFADAVGQPPRDIKRYLVSRRDSRRDATPAEKRKTPV
jgi:sterol desaturase/sphingolipid hydroxylase (fatty acid hydroxylase superfamily)